MQFRFYFLNTFLYVKYLTSYLIQSIILNLYSYRRPNKIKKLIKEKETKKIKFLFILNRGKGKITTISTSKTKKIMPIKKNFNENGTRDKENGSNPHSKGEYFSFLQL